MDSVQSGNGESQLPCNMRTCMEHDGIAAQLLQCHEYWLIQCHCPTVATLSSVLADMSLPHSCYGVVNVGWYNVTAPQVLRCRQCWLICHCHTVATVSSVLADSHCHTVATVSSVLADIMSLPHSCYIVVSIG